MKRTTLLLAGLAAGILLGVSLIILWPHLTAVPAYNGTVYEPPYPAPDFTLTNAAGETVNLSDFNDKLVLLYFGYTYCPDVCPATMADLARAQREVDPEVDAIQVIMISVDPERDTPEVAQEYAHAFHPSFIGLSGSQAEIEAITEPYGIYAAKQAGTAATGYLVDHTARVFLIDRSQQFRLSYPFGASSDAIAADLKRLLKE